MFINALFRTTPKSENSPVIVPSDARIIFISSYKYILGSLSYDSIFNNITTTNNVSSSSSSSSRNVHTQRGQAMLTNILLSHELQSRYDPFVMNITTTSTAVSVLDIFQPPLTPVLTQSQSHTNRQKQQQRNDHNKSSKKSSSAATTSSSSPALYRRLVTLTVDPGTMLTTTTTTSVSTTSVSTTVNNMITLLYSTFSKLFYRQPDQAAYVLLYALLSDKPPSGAYIDANRRHHNLFLQPFYNTRRNNNSSNTNRSLQYAAVKVFSPHEYYFQNYMLPSVVTRDSTAANMTVASVSQKWWNEATTIITQFELQHI